MIVTAIDDHGCFGNDGTFIINLMDQNSSLQNYFIVRIYIKFQNTIK